MIIPAEQLAIAVERQVEQADSAFFPEIAILTSEGALGASTPAASQVIREDELTTGRNL